MVHTIVVTTLQLSRTSCVRAVLVSFFMPPPLIRFAPPSTFSLKKGRSSIFLGRCQPVWQMGGTLSWWSSSEKPTRRTALQFFVRYRNHSFTVFKRAKSKTRKSSGLAASENCRLCYDIFFYGLNTRLFRCGLRPNLWANRRASVLWRYCVALTSVCKNKLTQ